MMLRLTLLLSSLLLISFPACTPSPEPMPADAAPAPNTLTEAERADGWRLLFDGETTAGWRGAHRDTFPAHAWVVEDGALVALGLGSREGGGSIVTEERFPADFDLRFEFKIEPNANSGVKYLVLDGGRPTPGHGLGLEYQIWDDAFEREDYHKMAALYELIVPENKPPAPAGVWNSGRIVVRGDSGEHWLNGARVVAYDRRSDDFRERIARSKYRDIENFGQVDAGRLLLQDEGGPQVAFRNLKIRY